MWCKVRTSKGKQNSFLDVPCGLAAADDPPRPFFPRRLHSHSHQRPTQHNEDRKMSAADDDDMVVDQQRQGQEDGEEAPRSGMYDDDWWSGGHHSHGQDTFDGSACVHKPTLHPASHLTMRGIGGGSGRGGGGGGGWGLLSRRTTRKMMPLYSPTTIVATQPHSCTYVLVPAQTLTQ